MRILSLENRWKLVVEAERFSNEQFASGFFRFITLAISPGEKDRTVDLRDFESSGFFLTTTVQVQKKKKGKRK